MIYRFKSKAAGDLILLEANGRQLLEIIGKDTGPQGIILPEEMDAAIEKLHAAVRRAESQSGAEPAAPAAGAKDGYGEPKPDRDVTLRQRAVPFIEMLRECKAADREVVWGV